jgi:hypothetical protein
MPARVGLVLAAPRGPAHGCVDELFCLVADVEQASDLGEAQADRSSERRGRIGLGAGRHLGGGDVGSCDAAGGSSSPFFSRCRWARTARKVWATIAKVICRYQA